MPFGLNNQLFEQLLNCLTESVVLTILLLNI
jgi:hypothetical protein